MHFQFSVCISVLDKFSDSLDDDVSQDARKIEGAFKRFCKATKGVENKFVRWVQHTNFIHKQSSVIIIVVSLKLYLYGLSWLHAVSPTWSIG